MQPRKSEAPAETNETVVAGGKKPDFYMNPTKFIAEDGSEASAYSVRGIAVYQESLKGDAAAVVSHLRALANQAGKPVTVMMEVSIYPESYERPTTVENVSAFGKVSTE